MNTSLMNTRTNEAIRPRRWARNLRIPAQQAAA